MEGENGHSSSEIIGDSIVDTKACVEHNHIDLKSCQDATLLSCEMKTAQIKKEKSHEGSECTEQKQINCKANQGEGKELIDDLENCQNNYKNGTELTNSSDLKSDSISKQNDDLDNSEESTSAIKTNQNTSDLLSTLTIKDDETEKKIEFVPYKNEEQLPDLISLITKDLSEPYSIYTYRYFLHNWPHLSHLAYFGSECVGAIVCKLDVHRKSVLRGYIAMLVVHKSYRRYKIGSSLVRKAIVKMIDHGCEEVVLETEVTNKAALQLYENLGFVRDKRLLRYYLNGVDAWRLKLWLK